MIYYLLDKKYPTTQTGVFLGGSGGGTLGCDYCLRG